MPKEEEQKQLSRIILAVILFLLLLAACFVIIRPFIAAILGGLILAYLLNWPFKEIDKLIKNRSISALIVCGLAVIILSVGAYFVAQITIKEAFDLYVNFQKIDLNSFLNNIFHSLFSTFSPEITSQMVAQMQQAIATLTSSFMNAVGQIMTDSIEILLQLFIAFFVAYYALKERDKTADYLKQVLPFSEEVNERFVKRSREVASATIYGHFLVGLIQGACAGVGFYIFGAQSPLLFTLLAIFFAMIPYLGPWVIWIPVSISLIASGNVVNGMLLLVFGFIFVSTIDNILRPYIISRRAKINQIAVLIGMLGGLIILGPVGLIAGPIILEYLLLFLELYKTKEINKFI